jgi:ribonuclease D
MKLAPAKYITTDRDLRQLVDTLKHESLIAVDTESNSLYAYKERVCLVQISSRKADYIVDPLAVKDMSPLGELLADPKIEKVFHAAEYDIMCLKRDYQFSIRNLFDTMTAARICGHKNIGLGSLLSLFAGIELDKSHQRDDWGQRPLPKESLAYAQMDTHYLPLLRDKLYEELRQNGRLEEALETFEEQLKVPAARARHDAEDYWKIALPNDLSRRETAAQDLDRPPFKVLMDATLITLARSQPQRKIDLEHIKGLSSWHIGRHGDEIVEAVKRGMKARPPQIPQPEITDPAAIELFTALRDWRKNRAVERGVESDVIISKDALWELARKVPTSLDEMQNISGLGPWRLAAYGSELLGVIQKHRNGAE